MLDNKRDGKGLSIDDDGTNYLGDFKNDKKEGNGCLKYLDDKHKVNSYYYGQFKEDEFQGLGIYKGNDGYIFEG